MILVSSAQIRSSGLLLGLPLLFLICMSFKSGISFLITFMLLRFLVPNLLLLVKISALFTATCILLSPFILLWPSINQSLFLALPFLDATVLLSTDRLSMFIINPEVLCCIIHKNRYKTTTLAILKNGPNTNYSILVEGFKFSWLISDSCNKAIQKCSHVIWY